MKEITSLLITTSCLALAGLGIYFFSSKSNDNDNKTGGKNKQTRAKRKSVTGFESKTSFIDNEISDDGESDGESDDGESDNESDNSETYKGTAKKMKPQPKNKTRTIKNKFATSRKKYY